MGLISRVSSRTYRNLMMAINNKTSAYLETISSISTDREFNRKAIIECLHEYKKAASKYQQYRERERHQVGLYETKLAAMKLNELHEMLRFSIDKIRLVDSSNRREMDAYIKCLTLKYESLNKRAELQKNPAHIVQERKQHIQRFKDLVYKARDELAILTARDARIQQNKDLMT